MKNPSETAFSDLQRSSEYTGAKRAFLDSILRQSAGLRAVRPARSAAATAQMKAAIQGLTQDRGRELYYPFVSSGIGSGPYVELLDGSVKMDMITGIGINFFGHTHPELLESLADGIASDVMQGNLMPGVESRDALQAILSRVGSRSRLVHGWLTCSGTMANENALKIIRQKHAPATRVFAFADCFAGRSTAMQEITDTPKYREGQPVYGEVSYLPFFDPKFSLEQNIQRTLEPMKLMLDRYPGKYAGLMIELVQGEGGFKFAPREFYVAIFEMCRKQGIAIWVDEIQTFGRTGELFAYQTFDLEEYVDVVTVGKLFQACAVLFTDAYTPRAGLVAGTFTGNSNTLRAAKKALEILDRGHYFGRDGKIAQLSRQFENNLLALKNGSARGLIGELRILGGMVGFLPFEGKLDQVKKLISEMFDQGLIAYYCGHDPYLIRLLPPLGAMEIADVDVACQIIEKSLLKVAASA